MGAALWSWFLVGSEGNVRHWSLPPAAAGAAAAAGPAAAIAVLNRIQKGRQASGHHVCWRSFRPSVAWCFGVAKGAFRRLAASAPAAPLAAAAGVGAAAAGPAAAIALFLTESRRIQKGRQASGQHVFGGRSVLQGHGVLLFRNRPLGLCCGAALRAWELHFGADFLSVQKATWGIGACLLGAASVFQCHGVLLFRNRRLGLRCGAASSSSSRPSSCNRFVLNRIQKDPEGTSSLGAACFWRSFRPSVAWCFGVARGTLWKPAAPAQQQQLNSLCFYQSQNPEGTSSPGTTCFWRSFRPSGPWCFAVSQPPSRTSAWELHFGAGFLSVQKATFGIGACLLGAASVFQCHGVLLFRNRPLGLRCGAALTAWELRFGAGFLSVQKAMLLSTRRFRPSGPWCFAVSQPPATTSLWSCFEGMGAALWSWFLVGSERNVRHQLQQHHQQQQQAQQLQSLPESRRDVKPRDSMFLEVVPSFRAMVFCCFATAR